MRTREAKVGFIRVDGKFKGVVRGRAAEVDGDGDAVGRGALDDKALRGGKKSRTREMVDEGSATKERQSATTDDRSHDQEKELESGRRERRSKRRPGKSEAQEWDGHRGKGEKTGEMRSDSAGKGRVRGGNPSFGE